jgi:hypothetical protein
MPRLAQFLIFLGIVLAVVVGVHYYLWVRLVRDAGWAPQWRPRLTALTVVLAANLPLSMFLSRALPPRYASWLAWPAYTWMGLMFILFVLVLTSDAARLLVACRSRLTGAPQNPERRELLGRTLAGVQLALGAGLGGYAIWSARKQPRVVELEVPIARLPPALDGTTIVQLTDIHIGDTLGREFMADVVERVNAMAPDVVAITGDLVDGSVDELAGGVAPLADLRARHGVYFVTGNHEYYSGAPSWVRHLESLGIRVLRNERVSIGDGAASYDLAGVDDWHAAGAGHRRDLRRALEGRDPSRACVLLAHQPRQIDEAAQLGVDLQLSGHTHGGQIWPFTYLVYLQQPYVAGLFHHAKKTWLYVSRGTGYWGPPMRLAQPAEITRITLRAGEGRARRLKG